MNEIKMEPGPEVITFPEIKSVIRTNLWKIVLLSLIVGFSTAIWMFMKPNLYQASAILSPIGEESKPSSALGALAAFGIPVGSSSKLEELEALFRSDDLT
jgi:hypothetical protein